MGAKKVPRRMLESDNDEQVSNPCHRLVTDLQSVCHQNVPEDPDTPSTSISVIPQQPTSHESLDVSGKNDFLRAAARADEVEFQPLLEQHRGRSADVNFRDFSKRTALMLASIAGCQAIVRSLLDNKLTQLDYQDMSGFTALMHAAQRGHGSIVEQLLKRGANNWLRDSSGNTAIILAARRNKVSCLKAIAGFITSSSGDWTVEGEFGLTAEQWAERNGRKEAAGFICEF